MDMSAHTEKAGTEIISAGLNAKLPSLESITEQSVTVPIQQIKILASNALANFGYPPYERDIILKVLLYAEYRGNSQGLIKLCGPGMPRDPNAGSLAIEKKTDWCAHIDGAHLPGMIVMDKAATLALEYAKLHKIGIVGTYNTSSSTGAIGYYARSIAKEGFIGLVISGTPPLVAPYGASSKAFGTNPLGVGIPTPFSPVVLDITTSAIAYFDVLLRKRSGQKLPGFMAYDSAGFPTDDPGEAIKGAFRPFDLGARSSGLSLLLEIFSGAWVGALDDTFGSTRKNWGNVVVAIDPALFIPREQFFDGVTRFINHIKNLPLAHEFREILIPGERGERRASEVKKSGMLTLSSGVFEEIKALAR